jgi:hypothetical protein
MGTGVIDPSFVRSLYGPDSIPRDGIDRWIGCLDRFRFVSVRGVESQRILADHGFDRATVIGDPALYYARETIVPKCSANRIGVNVSNYSHFWGNSQAHTVRVLSQLVSRLARQGRQVTLFPSMPEDCALSSSIRDAVSPAQINIFSDYSDREALWIALLRKTFSSA